MSLVRTPSWDGSPLLLSWKRCKAVLVSNQCNSGYVVDVGAVAEKLAAALRIVGLITARIKYLYGLKA